MTCRTLIAFAILILCGCKGEMEFKRVESESRNEAPDYRDMFLVANAPNDPVMRDSLLVAFAKKRMPDFCSLNVDFNSYSIYFYESTWCTRGFDEGNRGRSWSLAMDDAGCPDDKLPVSFYYKRSEENPKLWYLFYPQNPADTIYCQ